MVIHHATAISKSPVASKESEAHAVSGNFTVLGEILMAFPSSVPQGTCQVNIRISPETFLKLQQRVHRGKRTAFAEAVLRRKLDHHLATKPEAQK